MSELTQEKLEELVVGKAPNPNVSFFEKAVLDVAASKMTGRRVYQTQLFIKKTFPGINDWVPATATQKDIHTYREEYEYFMQNKQGSREPSIEIIPGLSLIHLQELLDHGLGTISRLAKAAVVPPHLQYAQDYARGIQSVLEGNINGDTNGTANGQGAGGSRESSGFVRLQQNEQDPTAGPARLHEVPREGRESRPAGPVHSGEIDEPCAPVRLFREAEDATADAGQVHGGHVGQPGPANLRSSEPPRDIAPGHEEARREYGDRGRREVDLGANFAIEVTYQ